MIRSLKRVSILILMFITSLTLLNAKSVNEQTLEKKFDLDKYHNVGNIWMRVSNYGYFGQGGGGDNKFPSLEYPGGSSIDYLYKGSLWFGAKKKRRNSAGELLFWRNDPPVDEDDLIAENSTEYDSLIAAGFVFSPVVDTLVTVGFDGDADLYEFLPAYNPNEANQIAMQYSQYNVRDTIMVASTRLQKRGKDDDGDGLIDEDPVGFAFPFRSSNEIPVEFAGYGSEIGGGFLADSEPISTIAPIQDNYNIWFPLGFQDLSYIDETELYIFAERHDDDGDGLKDEDGFPVSEQDFISYYYDYSPFGTAGQRDFGGSDSSNDHVPLNIRVRQMSYQWSYEYIKNLVYVEFDITNMNPEDILYDCAMGIYMDSDVGPQAWEGDAVSKDDISSYNTEVEFAYTYDEDTDGGLTTGFVGSRVCTPDPSELEFACWYWNRGDGPDDANPLDFVSSGHANQKYSLLIGDNAFDVDKYISLRDDPNSQIGDADDTRYLFAFYGDQQGMTTPSESSWNLDPGKTMKIVIAVFPGESKEEIAVTAVWAQTIYGEAQGLTEVVLPDTFPHYNPPEPPIIPGMYAKVGSDGNLINIYWDNRSEFTYDFINVTDEFVGWQDSLSTLDSYIGNYDSAIFPEEFAPPAPAEYNTNAYVNPWSAYRLRHDFQGYSVWGRSGSGTREDWELIDTWDKVETYQDEIDYNLANVQDAGFADYGGQTGVDIGLPQAHDATEADTMYYKYNELYTFRKIQIGEEIYGQPLYNYEIGTPLNIHDILAQGEQIDVDLNHDMFPSENEKEKALLFKNPNVAEDVYLSLYDSAMIPLTYMLGQSKAYADAANLVLHPEDVLLENIEDLMEQRLSRRYYNHSINYPRKGIEYYVAVTAFNRGMPANNLLALETARDESANMKVFFPGNDAKEDMDDIFVVPNPYVGLSDFDGRITGDDKGDKSKRLWFANLPEKCTVRIYTLAGDLVDDFEHDGVHQESIISISKAASQGYASSGIHAWNMLSRYNQIIASGVYLYSVENKDSGDVKVGKFVLIK